MLFSSRAGRLPGVNLVLDGVEANEAPLLAVDGARLRFEKLYARRTHALFGRQAPFGLQSGPVMTLTCRSGENSRLPQVAVSRVCQAHFSPLRSGKRQVVANRRKECGRTFLGLREWREVPVRSCLEVIWSTSTKEMVKLESQPRGLLLRARKGTNIDCSLGPQSAHVSLSLGTSLAPTFGPPFLSYSPIFFLCTWF